MIYYEDQVVGRMLETGSKTVTKQEIVDFAGEFDPHPFHLDAAAAEQSIYGGLLASGWHVGAITMRLIVDANSGGIATLGSPGFDDLKWLKPVRPGDTLTVRSTCIDKRPSRSKPDLGTVRFRTETYNQLNELVMSLINIAILRRRPTTDRKTNQAIPYPTAIRL